MVKTRKKLTDSQHQFIRTGDAAPFPMPMSSLTSEPLSSLNQDNKPYTQLSLDLLVSWDAQPRRYFDQSSLELLAKTITVEGIKHPIIVRPLSHNEKYEVIAGERRFQAAQLANLKTVPVLIQDIDDHQALEVALSENLHREELNPVEVLDSILQLLCHQLQIEEKEVCSLLRSMKYQWEKLVIKPQNINIPNPENRQQLRVAQTLEQFGFNWFSFVGNQLKLKNLPSDLYEAISSGRIEYSKGVLFKTIKSLPSRQQLLQQAIEENWTQLEIQQRIKELLLKEKPSSDKSSLTPSQKLNNTVSLLRKNKPWKKDPDTWKKIQRNLINIEKHLLEMQEKLSDSSENS